MTLAQRFGSQVRTLRQARGMSRAALAEALGVDGETVGRIERGERFNASNIEPIAAILGVEVRDLFTFDDTPAPAAVHASRLIDLVAKSNPERAERVLEILRILVSMP